jgi:hypothetical protein
MKHERKEKIGGHTKPMIMIQYVSFEHGSYPQPEQWSLAQMFKGKNDSSK